MCRAAVEEDDVRETARGAFELARPGNCVAAAVLTATGAFVAGTGDALAPAAIAAVTTAFAVAAGNAINDYFDREIDAINQPDRPIPRGAISPRGALGISGIWFAAAVALALALPLLALAIAAVNLVALVTYTTVFKGTPGLGNALVSYLVGSTFLFGGAAVGRPRAVVVLALLAALSTFAREVIKDVEDVVGDREEGLRTLPVAIGERRSLWLGVATMVIAVAASVIPFFAGFGVAYLAIVVPADAVMLHATWLSFHDPATAQRRLKRGMFLAAAAFIAGRIAILP